MRNIIGVEDGNHNCTGYRLDDWGRIVEIRKADGSREEYGYDGNGNCIRQRDVTGKVTEYRYDVCDRLAEVWDEGKRLASYAYQEDGRIREESHGPLRKAYTYDGEKNLTDLTLWSGDKLLADNRYRYDGNGNRTLKQQLRGETRYHFNPLNQLKRVDYPTYSEELFYDKAGNRVRRVVKEGAGAQRRAWEETYCYDSRNRLTERRGEGGTEHYTYDEAGNLLRDGRATYTYEGLPKACKG